MNYKRARDLMISLENGPIIPVTKAAANLAGTVQQENPTIITQNGYGVGVVMSIEMFRQLRELAREGLEHLEQRNSP